MILDNHNLKEERLTVVPGFRKFHALLISSKREMKDMVKQRCAVEAGWKTEIQIQKEGGKEIGTALEAKHLLLIPQVTPRSVK